MLKRIHQTIVAVLVISLTLGVFGPLDLQGPVNELFTGPAAASPLQQNGPTTIAATGSQQTFPNPIYLPNILNRSPLKTAFGVEMSSVVEARGLNLITEAGTDWIRRNALLWSEVEKTKGERNWEAVAQLEQEMINASQRGIDLVLVVRSTPSWAQEKPGVFCGPIRPSELSAFGDFMHDAVERYSAPPYNVRYWQIWNEPDVDADFLQVDNSVYGCLADPKAPYYGGEYYADILAHAYPKIKEANAAAKVVIGGLLMACKYPQVCDFYGASYLEGILKHRGANDGKNYFDVVAFHAYEDYEGNKGNGAHANYGWATTHRTTLPVISAKAKYIKALLKKYGAEDKTLMATEVALRCGPVIEGGYVDPSCSTTDLNHDFWQTKASYLVKSFASGLAEGLEALIWYDAAGFWRNSGLLTRRLEPSPAYDAYKVAIESLQDSRLIREITEYPGAFGFEFQNGAARVWVMWAKEGTKAITLPGTPSKVWNIYGQPVSPSGNILSVPMSPLYVKW